jgi:hypothetical protein
MLIGGGAAAVLSFATSILLLAEYTYSIKPNDRLIIEQFFPNNGSQGVYSISFPTFEGQPTLKIMDPLNQTIVEKTITPPIVSETFAVVESGYYTLVLTNPSSEKTLDASILFGDRQSFASAEQLIFSFMLIAGIITAIAGAVITVLDRRRSSKMRQFGDTSDLV